jgi:hypothetical protein
MNNNRRLRGGKEETYKVEMTYKVLGIPVASYEGKITKEDSQPQESGETAAAETPAETPAAETPAETPAES